MYREFTPCALLAPFIDKFWVFKGYAEIGTRFKILADGCTDFIFSIGNMTIPADEHQMIMQPYRSFFVGHYLYEAIAEVTGIAPCDDVEWGKCSIDM